MMRNIHVGLLGTVFGMVVLTTPATAQQTAGGKDINGNDVASIDAGTGDQVGIENVVTVQGTYKTNTYKNDAFEDVSVVAADPKLTVTKTANKTTGAVAGDIITYTYVIKNTGNVVLSGVTIDDQHDSAAPTTQLAVTGCTVTTDATVKSGSTTLNQNDTVIVAATASGSSDTFTTFGPADVVTCTSTYTVTQADVDQLQP